MLVRSLRKVLSPNMYDGTFCEKFLLLFQKRKMFDQVLNTPLAFSTLMWCFKQGLLLRILLKRSLSQVFSSGFCVMLQNHQSTSPSECCSENFLKNLGSTLLGFCFLVRCVLLDFSKNSKLN